MIIITLWCHVQLTLRELDSNLYHWHVFGLTGVWKKTKNSSSPTHTFNRNHTRASFFIFYSICRKNGTYNFVTYSISAFFTTEILFTTVEISSKTSIWDPWLHLFHAATCLPITRKLCSLCRNLSTLERQRGQRGKRAGKWQRGTVICSCSPQGRETDTSLVWSDFRFNILSYPLMIHHIIFLPTSLRLLVTHMNCISPLSGPPLSPSFISSSHITSLFQNISPLPFLFLFCPILFEMCRSFCFVGSYSVISFSAIFTSLQCSWYSGIWQWETNYKWLCRWAKGVCVIRSEFVLLCNHAVNFSFIFRSIFHFNYYCIHLFRWWRVS